MNMIDTSIEDPLLFPLPSSQWKKVHLSFINIVIIIIVYRGYTLPGLPPRDEKQE